MISMKTAVSEVQQKRDVIAIARSKVCNKVMLDMRLDTNVKKFSRPPCVSWKQIMSAPLIKESKTLYIER